MDLSVNSGNSYRAAEAEYRRLGRKAMRRPEAEEPRTPTTLQEGFSPLARQLADVPDLSESEALNLAFLAGRKLEESPSLSLTEHPTPQSSETLAHRAYEAGEAIARSGHSLLTESARAYLG